MALKPILTSGVALASAAAIVAATPALMTAPTVEVAAPQSAPAPTKLSTAQYELTALSLRNALNALFEGYHGDDSLSDPLGPEDVHDYLPGGAGGKDEVPGDIEGTPEDESLDDWEPYLGFGVEALIFYLIDEGLASLGIEFHHDDILFTAGQAALIYKIADDLNLLEVLQFISNPIAFLPEPIGDLLTDPVGLVEGTFLEPILRIFHDPVNADPTRILALLVALPTIIGEIPPISIITDPASHIDNDLLRGLITHPVGTIVKIIGALIPNDDELDAPEDDDQQNVQGLAFDATAPVEDEDGVDEKKADPFAQFQTKEFLANEELTKKAQEALDGVTPQQPEVSLEENVEDTKSLEDEGKDEVKDQTPVETSKPAPKSLSQTIKDARADFKAKAQEAKEERAKKREERREQFRSAIGLKKGAGDGGETGGEGGEGGGEGGGNAGE